MYPNVNAIIDKKFENRIKSKINKGRKGLI